MDTGHTEITAAARAVSQREAGHTRMAQFALPAFGAAMLIAGLIGLKSGELSSVRLAALCLSGLYYILSYSTLILGRWTIGMIPQAGIGAYGFVLAALWPVICALQPVWLRTVIWIAFEMAGAVVLFFLVLLAIMLIGSIPPRDRGQYTLMVLGSKLRDGKPGRMLRRRLDKAITELERDHDLMCIVSGGRAPDQPCAEAEAMERYLIERGIAPERIIAETLSSTTYENFLFSRQLLAGHHLPERTGVVTDRFHQFRSGRIARTAGMDSFPVSCRTAWYLAMQFWMRDALCIVERLITGHW